MRISAQLIDGRTGSHVWAERYDRELTDIFAIQDEISQAIVEALKIKLLPEERKAIEDRGTSSAEAYNLYLMARKYWLSGNYGDVRRDQRVIRICRRAVEIDPSYARAWALMAISQANLYFTHGNKDESALPAAERALEIEPSIAEAHCVKARYLLESGHAREANQEVELALRLGPEFLGGEPGSCPPILLATANPRSHPIFRKGSEDFRVGLSCVGHACLLL